MSFVKRFLASAAIAISLSIASAANAVEVYDQQLAAPAADENQTLEPAPPAPVESLQNLYRVASSLPEPANWLMMIIGFGSAGAILRRRRALGEFD
jgi:hypothetical protein